MYNRKANKIRFLEGGRRCRRLVLGRRENLTPIKGKKKKKEA